jgi:non-heme chloroperoxidase
MPFLETNDGTEIYFTDWGAGIPVVLIHGWPFNSDMWEKQTNFLAQQGLRVITYDRRGFGRSEQTWSGYDYDTLAADLNSLMEELDLHGASLVGFSMGGGEVVRYLSEFGKARVSKAVLISAVTPFLLKTRDNPEGVDEKVFIEIETNLLKDRQSFVHQFVPQFYGRSALNHTVSESVLEWSRAMGYTGSLRSTLQTAAAWSGTDFRDDLKNIDVPVRIIHGTSDATAPIEASGRRSAQLIANATLTEYHGEPHGLFVTAADRLNQELLEFITDTRIAVPETDAETILPLTSYSTTFG